MALPVPPGDEAFAALAPAPAAPEVIIFSFIYLFIFLYILGDIVYVGAFSVCATYILEI